jgi:hypothetical protein
MAAVNLATIAITPIVTLLGVALGGRLTLRNQDRLWRRDHARQWRDIRLSSYSDFLSAYRQYIAFALDPGAHITATPHPRKPNEVMPFFDETGRPYRENLEAAMMAIRLVSERRETSDTAKDLVDHARRIAAARAAHSEHDIPHELFDQLWRAHHKFLVAARHELDLSNIWPEADEQSPPLAHSS